MSNPATQTNACDVGGLLRAVLQVGYDRFYTGVGAIPRAEIAERFDGGSSFGRLDSADLPHIREQWATFKQGVKWKKSYSDDRRRTADACFKVLITCLGTTSYDYVGQPTTDYLAKLNSLSEAAIALKFLGSAGGLLSNVSIADGKWKATEEVSKLGAQIEAERQALSRLSEAGGDMYHYVDEATAKINDLTAQKLLAERIVAVAGKLLK